MIGVQLNIGEGRHALARSIFFGRLGELRHAQREGMEDQSGALGMALNANFHGRYPIVRSHGDGALRALRDPNTEQEWECRPQLEIG